MGQRGVEREKGREQKGRRGRKRERGGGRRRTLEQAHTEVLRVGKAAAVKAARSEHEPLDSLDSGLSNPELFSVRTEDNLWASSSVLSQLPHMCYGVSTCTVCVCLESTCIITSLWLGLIFPHSRFFEYKSQEGKPIGNEHVPLHNFYTVGKGAVIVTESKGRDRGHEVGKER